ncbi:protein UXT [Dermacentor andersoni]|uniref:protein UXT n=1 Tax=Dermacentor andersoni TaxID=34620 RepID=UPI002155F62C|nr:protein UXT-like [Dermacentor andersoni]
MADIRAKVLQYETFLNDVLKEDLRRCLEERDRICAKLAELLQLRTVVERIQEVAANKETFRTQVDLGCNFYVQAVVPDVSKIFVQVGMGFFVELTHEETLWFVGRREALLEAELQRVSKESANIKAHIQMVLQGLREIQGLPANPDQPKRRDVF